MKISEFQVGDVLTHPSWGDTTYSIVAIEGELMVLNRKGSNDPIPWDGYKLIKKLRIIRNEPHLSQVEQKIAYLDQLFKNRKE